MKSIRKYIKDEKERMRLKAEANIRADFSVVERGGFLWLTHHGYAFMKVASLSNAEDIAKELNKARDTAIEFERL